MKPNKLSLSLTTAAAAMLFTCTPLFASEADDRIESSFTKTYVYKTYLKDDAVKAVSNAGVVTLTGTVTEESHKGLAQETAAGLPGVNRVNNLLTTKADDASEGSDTWIGRKVTLALMFHRNVNSGKTSVTVKDGVVTLKGQASSMAQKELTAEYAKDIDGVKDVLNDMTVMTAPEMPERTTAEKLDDASITAQVKAALLTHRSTNSVMTTIQTRNGDVVLKGIAKNAAEKSLVSKLVNDIRGVGSVDNQMTIQEAVTK